MDEDLGLQKAVGAHQEALVNNVIQTLAEMAGIKAPIFTKNFMVKLKYITKGRLLATNPWNFFELV